MDELIIRVLDGTATSDEANRVARWKDESPENQRRFNAVELVWRETEPEPLSGEIDMSVVSRIVASAAEREETERRASISHRTSPARTIRWVLPLAAGIGAVALGVANWPWGADAASVFEAPATASETFVLDDGSFVRLAPGAKLRRERGSAARRYELDGRALFAVRHDESNPFTVVALGVETRVIGTRFEVSTPTEGRQRIVVLEGRVEVSNGLGRTELAAGEISVAGPSFAPSRNRADNVLALLDWPGGTLLFQNTPLAQVAREVGWHFGVRVVVEGEALRTTRISAWYGSEPFRDVVTSLCAATGASCSVSDTLAIIR